MRFHEIFTAGFSGKGKIFVFLVFLLLLSLLSAGFTDSSPKAESTSLQATGQEDFKELIDVIINDEKYTYSNWGFMAKDLDSGDVMITNNEDMMFAPGSTTKVFTVSSALEMLGSDYRFNTPVYYEDNNLILVASGDLAMGGRAGSGGTLEYTNSDHVDAGAFGQCILVETDPLAGLDILSKKIRESGILTVQDVVIDARLFDEAKMMAEGIITPIVINDNLIDITITPGKEGESAVIDWRPKSSAYSVANRVITSSSGSVIEINIPEYSGQRVIEITGNIPVDSGSVNMTSNVVVPAEFARSLFIDSLDKAGITVKAPSFGENPSKKLPSKGSYKDGDKIAELVSPPFSEYAKVTLKVSQNLYANCLLGIMAAHEGFDNPDYGLLSEAEFLGSAGVDLNSLALVDGEGSIQNRISPKAAIDLVSYMAGTVDYAVLKKSMPIFGVDGTLSSAAIPGSPGYGEIYAKTGTSLVGDMSGRIFMYARGLLGYMKTKNDNDVAFVIYVNNVPGASEINDIQSVVRDVNDVALAMYEYL